MRRLARLGVTGLALLGAAGPAQASSDMSCDPAWKVASRDLGCGSSAVIAPGNDSRANLLFLLRDRAGLGSAGVRLPEPEWAERAFGRGFFDWRLLRAAYYPREDAPAAAGDYDYLGSRCVSLASGGAAFAAALEASRALPAAERSALQGARGRLAQTCEGAAPDTRIAWPGGVTSAAGREFLAYLVAADAFYGESWDAASGGFAPLARAKDPWLREAARYMAPRVALNAAQAAAFDEWGGFGGADKVDRAALRRAQAGFAEYLRAYPQGRYAGSAQGLVRRALWLAGDRAALAREYDRLAAALPATGSAPAALIDEIDNKLLVPARPGDGIDAPLLLAAIDLMAMRRNDYDGEAAAPLSAADLAAQQPVFADQPELWSFLQANHAFYVADEPRRVLALIPDDARRAAYAPLAFSRQMLRGLALAAVRDRNEAGFWRELIGGAAPLHQRPMVELALAQNLERSGKLAEVFAAGSPIGDEAVRGRLLAFSAGPDILRATARASARPPRERDIALFTLLYKQLTRGRYADFARDAALVRADAAREGGLYSFAWQEQIPVGLFRAGRWTDGYPCPAIARTASALARNPGDARARLCLGDFLRLNGFDGFGELDSRPPADELGGAASLFPGQPLAREDIYLALIADPKAGGEDKAYALYRMVHCYAPAGYNGCGKTEHDEAARKGWHDRLKREFPGSQWARKLRYFW